MTEHGTIVEIEGDRTVVELKRTAQCGHCRCHSCVAAGGGTMRITVDTVSGVSVGDAVEIEIPVSRLKAVLTVLVLPLAAVLVGALLGTWLTETYYPDSRYPNLPAILLALVLVVLTYVGVFLYERRGGSGGTRPYIKTGL